MSPFRTGLTFLACCMLAACGADPSPAIAEQGGEPVDCAPAGQEQFGADCMMEVSQDTVVVRNPDGGFHRLRVLPAGQGYTAADGADAVTQEIGEGVSTVGIAGDRYVLPLKGTGMADNAR